MLLGNAKTPPPRMQQISLDIRTVRSGSNLIRSGNLTNQPQRYHSGTARPTIVHADLRRPYSVPQRPHPHPVVLVTPSATPQHPRPGPCFCYNLHRRTGATLSQARLDALAVHSFNPRAPCRPLICPQPSLSTRQALRSVQSHCILPGLPHSGSRLLQQPPVDLALLF